MSRAGITPQWQGLVCSDSFQTHFHRQQGTQRMLGEQWPYGCSPWLLLQQTVAHLGTSPTLPSPQLACGQGKTPLLPKPPNSHMKAISWTSVRDWTPPCSRSVHRFPKPNYFPWLRQHATTWLVIFSLPKDVSQHSKPAGANSKILIPIQNYTAALFPLGIHYHCPNL